jgi:hypothetical protein
VGSNEAPDVPHPNSDVTLKVPAGETRETRANNVEKSPYGTLAVLLAFARCAPTHSHLSILRQTTASINCLVLLRKREPRGVIGTRSLRA